MKSFLVLLVSFVVSLVTGLKCKPTLELSIKWNVDCSALNLSSAPLPELFHPVVVLNLSHNLFTHLENSHFSNWTEIIILDLSFNNIQNIDEHSFSGLTNLNELNLKHNKIEVLSTNITNHLPKLKILNLSSNKLKIIKDGVFQSVPQLLNLFLENNIDLGKTEENYINLNKSLKQGLYTLNISNISLAELPKSFFNCTNYLISLSIAHNPLKNIEELPSSLRYLNISGTLIESLPSGIFFKSDTLQKLSLEQMPLLRQIKANAFLGLYRLEELNIKDCPKLNFISENAFGSSIPKLQRVTLANTALTTLPKTFEPLFNKVNHLDLQGNPWICDGQISWISHINISSNLLDNLRCEDPPTARGITVVHYFQPRSLHPHSSLLRAAVVLALVAVLVGGVVGIIRRSAKQKTKAYCHLENIGLQDTSNKIPPLSEI
ncbi:leucine-rich repeat neuronal protein 1-like [Homalodisca vitripennis]|uniref:leucine-rich repeat neuronal protein 1-like n=1 Tax=Homalodisca vitripennis TaxID=197043 RepID=UPI001EEC51E8|nr:leucine-rich repeat neuronal protein 1-like [Homalodisca vitripennis]